MSSYYEEIARKQGISLVGYNRRPYVLRGEPKEVPRIPLPEFMVERIQEEKNQGFVGENWDSLYYKDKRTRLLNQLERWMDYLQLGDQERDAQIAEFTRLYPPYA